MYDTDMATFPQVTHIALTVSDLDRSIAWYERLFASPPFFVDDEETYRFAVWIEPMLALHEHGQRTEGGQFSEFRAGLDHVSFGCESRRDLEEWQARLDQLGIERGEIVDAFYGSGLAFRDPDHIQLEFFVPVGS